MGPFKTANALVIDDNEHMVAITSAMLRAFGFGQVLSVEDARKGFDILADNEIDLIVVDYRMPHMDGISFVHRLRQASDSPNRFIPIIMLSAHSEKARICQARDTGVTEFLCKPLAPSELFKKIATMVDNPRPFVCTEEYFGPDRRRKANEDYNGPERRRSSRKLFAEDLQRINL